MLGADQLFGDRFDLLCGAAKQNDFHAVVMVEVGVHRGDDIVVMLVLLLREVLGHAPPVMIIDQHDRGRRFAAGRLPFGIDQVVADEIADSLGTVGIPALLDIGVETLEQLFGQRDTETDAFFHAHDSSAGPVPNGGTAAGQRRNERKNRCGPAGHMVDCLPVEYSNRFQRAQPMQQYTLTPAAGKRLIAKAVAAHRIVRDALRSGTVVVIAGTTNGYVAEEILTGLGQADRFDRSRFFRGVTLPPSRLTSDTGRLPDESRFPGDVVIVKGEWQCGKTIFDVVGELKEGDVILKGANAIDPVRKRAAVLIGHPQGGTITAALQAVVGRRVHLLVPAGLEKRVAGDLDTLAARLNAPGTTGPRLLPIPGDILTETEAVELLTGATAELTAAGGVCGAEGSIWLAVSGTADQEQKASELLRGVRGEPAFTF